MSNIDECEEVRRGGVTLPVLMLGFTPADQAERILELDMTQAVQPRHRQGVFRRGSEVWQENEGAYQARYRHGPARLFVR